MLGLIISIFVLGFGIFLKVTNNPGFASSKKYSWFFIIVGLLTLAMKIYLYSQKGSF